MTILADDLGWYDTQVHNPASPTPTIGSLVAQGIALERACKFARRDLMGPHLWPLPRLLLAEQARCRRRIPLLFADAPQLFERPLPQPPLQHPGAPLGPAPPPSAPSGSTPR